MALFIIALAVHLLAAVIWVGGMFFAHVVLRPSLQEMAPPERLALMERVLGRFFRWVWLAIAVLLVSGYGVLLLGYRGGITGGGPHIDLMQIAGLAMIGLFAWMYFTAFADFRAALARQDFASAAPALGRIRLVVGINLVLGAVTTILGGTGTLWAY